MDARAHQRFLEYLEKQEYFARPDVGRLTRAQWVELDEELGPLREKQARDALTAAELTRCLTLRRLLLVD